MTETFVKRRVRESFSRAGASYDAAAAVQREIAERLLVRLDLVKLTPQRVLDLGSGTGYCAGRLERRYRRSHVLGIDAAWGMTRRARAATRFYRFRRRRFVCADIERLPLREDSADLAVCNLALHWCEPGRAFREFLRVLKPGGLLMFASFGPDTLQELRNAWRAADAAQHVHRFIDMHDLGDALIHEGFADPVMDMEFLTLTYPSVAALLSEIKRTGGHHLQTRPERGLMGKGRWRRFQAAYEAQRVGGRIPATIEVVYGHAWVPERKRSSHRLADGTVAVPLDRIRRGRS